MTSESEEFASSMQYIESLRNGWLSYREETPYRAGFFDAVMHWSFEAFGQDNSFDDAFRHVVTCKEEYKTEFEERPDEWQRGYNDALRLFRKAKGLSRGGGL